MNNAELIEALRYCADEGKICTEQTNCGYYGKGFFCQDVLMNDAADALEAADKRIKELEAQIPKKGEWIMCESEKPYIVYKCSICGGMTSEHGHYCPNCGAKMREGEEK